MYSKTAKPQKVNEDHDIHRSDLYASEGDSLSPSCKAAISSSIQALLNPNWIGLP